jgi:hypothetical protein
MTMPEEPRKLSPAERGAGLVGLVLALLTMGILAASSYYVIGPAKTVRELKSNNTDFARIQKAIAIYVARNDRLPCPADGSIRTGQSGYGDEGRNGSNCTASFANSVIPWRTLGLDEKVSTDAWGRRLSYHPYTSLVTNNSFVGKSPTGSITVTNEANCTAPTPAVYVVISHGSNGLGGWTIGGTRMSLPTPTNEAENTSDNNIFIKGTYDSNSATYFDDQVVCANVDDVCDAAGIGCTSGGGGGGGTATNCAGCIIFDRTTLSGYVSGNSFKMGTNEVTINGVEIKGSNELTASKSGDGAGLGVLGGGSNGYPDAGINTTSETITIEFASSKKTFAIALNGFTASSGTARVNISDTQGNTVRLPAIGGTACGATQAIFNNISFTGTPNFQKLVIKPDNANTSFWIAAINGCSSTTTCDASVSGFTSCTYP